VANQPETRERLRVHVSVSGPPQASVSTGLPVLDHLVTLMAEHAALALALEVAPGSAGAEVVAAAQALGEALNGPLRAEGVRGYGSAAVPADEALAHVALEASDRPLLVSNVDLSDERVGGLGRDLVADFLRELAQGAGLTLHVRLIDGDDPQHVLEAIFKALGVAIAQACRPRVRKEER
jgi:imidazoleglycerol-phosphate dehydratase